MRDNVRNIRAANGPKERRRLQGARYDKREKTFSGKTTAVSVVLAR
jgi:hypothetical protein